MSALLRLPLCVCVCVCVNSERILKQIVKSNWYGQHMVHAAAAVAIVAVFSLGTYKKLD